MTGRLKIWRKFAVWCVFMALSRNLSWCPTEEGNKKGSSRNRLTPLLPRHFPVFAGGLYNDSLFASSTFRTAWPSSRTETGFNRYARIPRAWACSLLINSLKPVQRMIGRSGRRRSAFWASSKPVRRGMVISVMSKSKAMGFWVIRANASRLSEERVT